MISILLNCRVEGNSDCKLLGLLDSLKKCSNDYTQFEVLIKFDSDDTKATDMIKHFPSYPFPIKYIVDKRGRGPMDFHLGMTTLTSIANINSEIYMPLADDFEVLANWDIIVNEGIQVRGVPGTDLENWVIERLDGNKDLFIIQSQGHPGHPPENLFNMNWSYDSIDSIGFETIPIFSKKVVQLLGGFGHMSFTDAWATLLQHELWNSHGISITRFTNSPYVKRMPQAAQMDLVEQANREGQRVHNFRFIKSSYYRQMLETQGTILADYYTKYRKKELEFEFVQKARSIYSHFNMTRTEYLNGKAITGN